MRMSKRILASLILVSSISIYVAMESRLKKADVEKRQENNAASEHILDIKREMRNSVELREEKIRRKKAIVSRKQVLSAETKEEIAKVVCELDSLVGEARDSKEMSEEFRKLKSKIIEYYGWNKAVSGLVAVELINHIYTAKTDETKFACLSAAGTIGDERCVGPLKQLLDSKEITLSPSRRAMAYLDIANLGGSDQIAYLRSEYAPWKTYDERYILAVELAMYGDATGALTLIEALGENTGNEEICSHIRKYLTNLDSVDLGNDIEAWKKVVETGKGSSRQGKPGVPGIE